MATGATGTNAGVYGQIPASGSSSAYGVRGENLNTSGGVGGWFDTRSSSGRAILANGSIYINNNNTDGSATGASDVILAKTNSGGFCGFNSAGQSFNASDRNVKENFAGIDSTSILNKLVALEITEWNFKKTDASIKYVGPMAQDFHAAFGLGGSDDKVIPATNAQGIAFAAIKGLNSKVEDKAAVMEARFAQLESRIVTLEEALNVSRSVATGNLGIGMAIVGVPAVLISAIRRRRNAAKAS